MKLVPRSLIVGMLVLGLGAASRADELPEPTKKAAATPTIPFSKYSLKNGLEVILHEDHSLPLVAVNVWYHVGPANEPAGRSGFAHLFEHLMFEGSRHVGRRFDTLLEAAGATNVNGTTSWDRTNYFETVPRQYLELVLWIESDRMGFLLDALTPERLEVQRGVVKNERRQSYEMAPYGPSSLVLLNSLFPEGHPYHGAVIGSMKDLSAASMADVRRFFGEFYAASNATLTIAGDIDVEKTRQLIERYFGPLPTQPQPQRTANVQNRLKQPVRRVVSEPVQLARVAMGWITPPAFSADDPPLEVAAAILAGGKATRLYRSLVVERKIASDVDASLDNAQLGSIFTANAVAASGSSEAELETALGDVLTELAKSGPSEAELRRAKRRITLAVKSDLQLLNGPGGESGRAGTLQRLNHYTGDPGGLDDWLAQIEKVDASDVQRVVKKYLDAKSRVVVVTRPEHDDEAAPTTALGRTAP